MMTLLLAARETASDSEDLAVAWRTSWTSTGNSGILLAARKTADPLAAAELMAARHLLFFKKVFKRDIVSGTGYRVYASQAVIRKVARGASTKQHLNSLGDFFHFSFDGADVQVLPQGALDAVFESGVISERIPESSVLDLLHVETPSIGPVAITRHAVDAYAERIGDEKVKNPARSLFYRLKHDALKRQPLPGHVLEHKAKRYGSVEHLEVWGHASSSLHFLCQRDPATGVATLVTVYDRPPSYC